MSCNVPHQRRYRRLRDHRVVRRLRRDLPFWASVAFFSGLIGATFLI